jgi:homoserine O-acetyltransferase
MTTGFVDLPGTFTLESGAVLDGVRVAYQTWGTPSSTVILVCHALTGSADAADWWPGLFGPGKVLDPDRSYVVSMNVLGGCNGTTGPTSRRPGNGTYGPDFPAITIRDMVHVQAKALEHLGVEHLELVIGGSMGGMQALEWAALYPERVGAIVPIGVGASQSPWCVALSEAQRSAIVNDPRYRNGRYRAHRRPDAGLATARQIAMCTYRSPESFGDRFPRGGRIDGFAVQSYLRYQGEKIVRRFDPNTYLALITAMDTHDIGRDRGGTAAALSNITAPAFVVAISSDLLYPVAEVTGLAGGLGDAELAILDSPHGHDAFLIETGRLNDLVTDWISRNGIRIGRRRAGSVRR